MLIRNANDAPHYTVSLILLLGGKMSSPFGVILQDADKATILRDRRGLVPIVPLGWTQPGIRIWLPAKITMITV